MRPNPASSAAETLKKKSLKTARVGRMDLLNLCHVGQQWKDQAVLFLCLLPRGEVIRQDSCNGLSRMTSLKKILASSRENGD